ncbi:MAG: S1/P1 Nuclease, partial [Bacteroidetes bacterium]|nr:S1/P1 Nuclease [Bacteroidota bacterium]
MKKLLSFALLLGTFKAFSWGLTGHRIVGHVAMDHLNPEVRSHILETLGGEDLAQVS